MISQQQAQNVICKVAKTYDENLNNRNLLIITGKQNPGNFSFLSVDSIQTIARKENFLHLTGVETSMSAELFFQKAFNSTLTTGDFSVTDNTVELKLAVIERDLSPSKNFRMFGQYSPSRPNLRTDYLVGGEICSVGFIKSHNSDLYVPNTVLNGDMRDDVSSYVKVLAVLKKDITASEYQKAVYIAKNVFLHELFEKIQLQNPDIHINIDYETELTKSQLAKEKEFMQKAEITELSKTLNQARNSYLNDSENMDLLEQYDTAQKNFALKANEYNMYDYAEALLNQQKAVSKSSEVREYIDSDIRALKKECGLTFRSADIVQTAYAASPEVVGHDSVAVPERKMLSLVLLPEHPFKALWVKAREIVRDIADSLHMTKKADRTEQKEESFYLEPHDMCAVKRHSYTDFVGTGEALKEIGLQTGLLFQQKAVQEQELKQEHLKPSEQVETKKKSKQMEYGD